MTWLALAPLVPVVSEVLQGLGFASVNPRVGSVSHACSVQLQLPLQIENSLLGSRQDNLVTRVVC